jgi:hypothetical protein
MSMIAPLSRSSSLRVSLSALVGAASMVLLASPSVAAGGAKASTSDSPYIGQSQIVSTVVRSFRAVGTLQVDMGIMVSNPAQRARATALRPVLRDTWRRTSQEFTNNFYTPGRVPDAALLAQRLQAATDQIIGPGTGRVILTSVIVR